MKRVMVLLLAGTTLTVAQGTPAERLERGVFLQENEKDLDAAIAEFQSVLREESKAKQQGAEARYRLLQCYLAKGDEKAADEQWRALKSGYAADNRWVLAASKLQRSEIELVAAPWTPGELLIYTIKGPSGQEMGHMMAGVTEEVVDGGKVWVSYFVRHGGVLSLSRAEFSQDDYRSLRARTYMEGFGDYSTEFPPGGGVTAFKSDTGEETWRSDGKSVDGEERVLYDNDQFVQIMRLVPLEIGTKYATQVVMGLNSMPVPFDLEVVEHEEITTEAGTFQCAKLKTNMNQDFWISRDEHRYLVRIGIAAAKVDLAAVTTWDPAKGETVTAEEIGAKLALSGDWLYLPPVDKADIFRMNIMATDFAPQRAMVEINLTKNLVEEARNSSRAFAEVILIGAGRAMDELTVDEDSWVEGKLDGLPSVSVVSREKKGEIRSTTYHVYAVGEEKSVAIRFTCDEKDLAEVRKKADELVKGITLK